MDSKYITILCGCFNDNYSPLTRAEFWKLYHERGDSVKGIVESGDERVERLLERSGAVTFALEKMNEMGIRIRTFLDEDFPRKLISVLKDFCPPLLYLCGDSGYNNHKYAGYVGSRNIEVDDIDWTQMMVSQNIRDGFGIVSGGAKGIDSVSIKHALTNGGYVMAYLPDNIKTMIQDNYYRKYIEEGRLILCSPVSPFAPKTKTSFVAAAMERNKLIYAQSAATAVVRSDYNKGGTWAGAVEAIKHMWTPVFVWDNKNYEGNQRLIEMGGIPISTEGKRIDRAPEEAAKKASESDEKQYNIFDYMNNK